MAKRVRLVLRGWYAANHRCVCSGWFSPRIGLYMSGRSVRDAVRRAGLISGDHFVVDRTPDTAPFESVHVYDGLAYVDELRVVSPAM